MEFESNRLVPGPCQYVNLRQSEWKDITRRTTDLITTFTSQGREEVVRYLQSVMHQTAALKHLREEEFRNAEIPRF